MKSASLTLIAIVISISCTQKTEILTGKNHPNPDEIAEKLNLKFYSDNTFYMAVVPNISSRDSLVETGKYEHRNDTILIDAKNWAFRKAIVKDGFIEFCEASIKVPIVRDETKWAHDTKAVIPKDFTIFSYCKRFSYELPDGKPADLETGDFTIINRAIQVGMNSYKQKWLKGKREADYVKQCICIRNKKGEKEVYVGGISKSEAHSENSWKTTFKEVSDGGSGYFNFKMNVATGKVAYFNFHGSA